MKILGIESSCDETAAAVVEDGSILLSHVVISQIDIHKEFGGVVPEVAARSHVEVIAPVIEKALQEANCQWTDIDGIALTKGPGLSGSLLIGSMAARTLAITKQKPIYGLHHVLGHVFANMITRGKNGLESLNLPTAPPQFPLLALIVSGGHSQLVLFNSYLEYKLLGQTQDDAIGEAFDKVAKIIGLPYPGGPSISNRATEGDPKAFDFPISKLDNPYNFSFSGLKTAVLRKSQQLIGEDYSFPSFQIADQLTDQHVSDIAASFQATAIETLVRNTKKATEEFRPRSVVIAGGVAANKLLRSELKNQLPNYDIQYAPMSLCTDNAAMMAALGFYYAQHNDPDNPYDLDIKPSWSM
ncbi:TPA: tRNA (adenosine(37)-N6)-threonylcarbamoyltransferase complex transferase subunit TsaD [Candidatus Saccharibacteria bacterium]|nr:tRNA (adenosine(37)-N6)-threonylcarbamoyltransferase complex transferase subunit TsaD [Candidatus Saccharibacteria bacterium]HIO87805.1 tRNA (adenosine(37)-N6)-threonylcarbamoyltransferase complex transferase subunit TsaD [Candidatus Saccharibacteria bacterium]